MAIKGKPVPKYKVGDRVAERPKDSFIPNLRAESRKIAEENQSQRYGTIIEIILKENANNAVSYYYKVRWDNINKTMTHAQFRLRLLESSPAENHVKLTDSE